MGPVLIFTKMKVTIKQIELYATLAILTRLSGLDMVPSNVYQRVLLIRFGDNFGSAFTIELDQRQYLISARHIFCKQNDLEQLLIQPKDKLAVYKGGWKNLEVETIECASPLIDVIAFSLPKNRNITPDYEIVPSMGEIIFTQDVYFLGFPYGLRTDMPELNNGYPLPFVKKGIASAMGTDKIYVDGHVNKGFSGGPVVFQNVNDRKFHIGAIVSGYLHDQKDDKKTTDLFKENSGIFEAFSINTIVKAIQAASNSNKLKQR